MNQSVRKLTISAMFLAVGIILPMAFHSFGPNAGATFLPMHLPVLLCGFLCGPAYGAFIGVLTPLLSSFLTGMPVLVPTGIAMVFELSCYGCLSGLLLKHFHLYVALILTMLAGRIVNGIVNLILLSFMGKAYTLTIFLTVSFITAIPGILLQLLLVPLLVKAITHFQQHAKDDA